MFVFSPPAIRRTFTLGVMAIRSIPLSGNDDEQDDVYVAATYIQDPISLSLFLYIMTTKHSLFTRSTKLLLVTREFDSLSNIVLLRLDSRVLRADGNTYERGSFVGVSRTNENRKLAFNGGPAVNSALYTQAKGRKIGVDMGMIGGGCWNDV